MAAVRTRRVIDDQGADAVIAAAESFARERGYRVVITVVAGGLPSIFSVMLLPVLSSVLPATSVLQ